MKTQQVILRKIAQQNLDPTVPYVAGKNGNLVSRSTVETSAKDTEEKTQENQDQPEVEPLVMGSLDQESLPVVQTEEKPKKKFPPFKKKKDSDS